MLNSDPEDVSWRQVGKSDGLESSQEDNQIKERPSPRRNYQMKIEQKPQNNLTFTHLKDRELPRVEYEFSRDDLEF